MDSWIDTALRAAPGSDESRELGEWLRDLDDDKWRVLLPEISEIAREAARKAVGVLEPDDVRGELAVLAFERWLPRYRDELAKGTAPSSLRAFLKLRIDRHVAELRRKQRRRRQLLASAMPVAQAPEAEPILVGRTGEPYTDAVASELMRKAGSDKTLRAVLALKYAGFTQDEIASYLEVSRPTVTRRVATLAAALTVLVAIGLTAWWFTRSEDAPIVTPDGEVRATAPARGAAPAPSPRPPTSSPPLTPERVRASVGTYSRRMQRCWASYKREVPDAPTLRFEVSFDVTEDGHSWFPRVLEAPEPLRRCMESELRVTRWGRQSERLTVTIPYGFSLEAEEIPNPTVEPALTELSGPQIRTVVDRRRSDAQRCYEAMARRIGSSPTIRVNAELTIEASGEVSRQRVAGFDDRGLRRCLEAEIRTWRFPPSTGATSTTIPFVFRGPRTTPARPARGDSDGTVEQQAVECTSRGDNQCVIRTLEGRARSPRALSLLIEAYRAQGRTDSAMRHMGDYVDRWPTTPQGRAYAQILERAGR